MKISTKGRYALSLMIDIMINENGRPVSLKDVSQRQKVSEKYLEQIANILAKSGLLHGVRGANGGYMLCREGKDYTVGEILRVMEGDLAPAPCVEKNGCTCKRIDICTNVVLWEKINEAINSIIDNTTLEDMYKWQHKK